MHDQQIDSESSEPINSRFPLWIAILANLVSFLLTLGFFRVSAGARIRPRGWSLSIFVIGLGALIVLPLVLLNLKRLRGRWPKYAIALAFTPIPLALVIERIARGMIGYSMEP